MNEPIQSLREQLAQAQENLRLIQERKAEYVLETDVPLQLVKEERRLEAQIADLRARLARLAEAPCPYRGLLAFREQDTPFFFGREVFTQRLVEAVQQHPLVAVVGPSGSGKSSVVSAGLLPRLRQADGPHQQDGGWAIAKFRPGSRPCDELANALLPLLEPEMSRTERLVAVPKLAGALREGKVGLYRVVAGIVEEHPQAGRLLLVIDQFEELYTLCPEVGWRRRFLDVLLAALAQQDDQRTPVLTVVLILRAGFLGQALTYRPFADTLDQAQKLMLGPMTPDELEAAIVRPAERQGVIFEEGLVARILDDVGSEPGNLPLLEFALTQLWERRQIDRLTHAAYDAIGQVEGALARYAEDVYGDLRRVEQRRSRRVLVHMVCPGTGTEDTRRLAARTELGAADWVLVHRLANARLVVTGRDSSGQETVEIVHETLIHGWGRLRSWLDEDREFLLWQQRLRVAMAGWQRTGHDEGALLRGAPLAEAERWFQRRSAGLDRRARRYIQRSVALRQQEEAARELARATRERLRRRFTMALIAGLIATVALAVLVSLQWRQAEGQRRIALSRQLAAQAIDHADDQIDLALLLSLEASRFDDSVEARGSLLAGLESSPHLVAFLRRHRNYVYSVAVSPDGQTLASGSADGTVILWDLARGQPVGKPLTGHPDQVHTVAFSPDGLTLASGGAGGTIILWALTDDRSLARETGRLLGHEGSVHGVAFSPDGRTLASAGEDGAVILWDLTASPPSTQTLSRHTGAVWSVAFGPDGGTLASGGEDDTIILWDLSAGHPAVQEKRRLTGHSGAVKTVAFSPDGQTLASGSDDQNIILWEMGASELISHTLSGHWADVWGVAFSPDEQTLASGSRDHRIILWDVTTRQRLVTLTGHANPVRSVAFSPDGQTLVSGGYDHTVILWDNTTRQRLARSFAGHEDVVRTVAFSPDEETLASGSHDSTVILWNVADGQQRGDPLTQHTDWVYSVAFSPDGRILASGSKDGKIILWDVSTGQRRSEILTGSLERVYSVAFSPHGRMLASGGKDGTITFWDTATNQPVGEPLVGHADRVFSLAFSPDGQVLASGSADDTARLWNVDTGQAVGQPLTGHEADVYAVAFSPDGQTLASGSVDGTVVLWDIADRQPRCSSLVGHVDTVMGVAFSPDGQTLASSSRDDRIILWDVPTCQPLGRPLYGHRHDVYSVAFSPDGRTLASGSRDKQVILWDVDIESWQGRACAIASRSLTREEWRQYLGDEPYHETCPGLPVSGE